MAPKESPAHDPLWLSSQSFTPASASPPPASRSLEEAGFRSLYEQWFVHVARWIRACGGPPPDQDDLLQDVFLVAFRRFADFDGQNPAAWLYRITVHQVRDHRRRLWIKHIFKGSTPLSDSLPAPGPTPVTALEAREQRQLLDRLLSKLSEPMRVAFVLFEIEGYSGDEIASIQQTSINTVRTRILRARQRMTTMLRKAGDQRGGQA